MEHDEKPLPIDIRLLGALAEKVHYFQLIWYSDFLLFLSCFCIMIVQCHAYAKALHYKEMEFEGAQSKKMDANPVSVVEALIHINNQLHQHEV